MDFLLFILIFVIFILHLKISDRVRKCELLLDQIRRNLIGKKEYISNLEPPKPPDPVVFSPPEPPEIIPVPFPKIASPFSPPVMETEPVAQVMQPQEVDALFAKLSTFSSTIKENWMGLFGSLAIVIGAVFFGLTSKIMQMPQARVGLMILVSLFILGISKKLQGHELWSSLSGWLKSIAGTVILFATLGAGGIEGLKFIDSPLYALAFLCTGIVINLFIAHTTSYQSVASLHVILSICAFCIVPQSILLLPIGAVVTIIGLLASYRSKWNLHLFLIVLAFACQNGVLTFTLGKALLPWMDQIAIACAVAVGLIAGLVPYSKKYESSSVDSIPLMVHLANWALLAWNIGLHAPFFKGTAFVLALIALAGFFLARIAKQKGVLWLYYTDTILSQCIAMLAIMWLVSFGMKPLNIMLLLLLETTLFSVVCLLQRENVLLRAGYLLQWIICLGILPLLGNSHDIFINCVRLGLFTALSWCFYLILLWKNFTLDDFRWVLFGETEVRYRVSVTAILGTIPFLAMYLIGYQFQIIQLGVIVVLVGLGFWRKWKEDQTWNIVFMSSLVFIHFIDGTLLFISLFKSSTAVSKFGFIEILLLDGILIFGNLLQFKIWKQNFHSYFVYALGIQMGCLTYILTKEISLLIPGLAFLGLSLIFLEGGRFIPHFLHCDEKVKDKIRESMIHVGLAFLVGFFSRFLTVNLQVDPIWQGISLRLLTEAFALATLFYWILFYPRKESDVWIQFFQNSLVEICLGFITLCIFTEMAEMWRPLSWMILSIGLLLGSLNYHWSKRLNLYSWGYFIASILHVAFITSSLNMPTLFLFERFYFPAILATALQFCYAFIVYHSSHEIEESGHSSTKDVKRMIFLIYHHFHLTIVLPLFLGIAFLFAFNFEKALLTISWVGLISLYLGLGLLMRSKVSIQIAMGALLLCSFRLMIFDFRHSDLATRSLVFIGVGILMLGISVLYKKYKYRIEMHEQV